MRALRSAYAAEVKVEAKQQQNYVYVRKDTHPSHLVAEVWLDVHDVDACNVLTL